MVRLSLPCNRAVVPRAVRIAADSSFSGEATLEDPERGISRFLLTGRLLADGGVSITIPVPSTYQIELQPTARQPWVQGICF